MSYIYVIGNRVNWKVYVGQSLNPVVRFRSHRCLAVKGDMRPLYASMRKHGIDQFEFLILEECSSEEVNKREKFWVDHFDSHNFTRGYNLTKGGQFEYTPEIRQKMRDRHRRGMLGKTHSPEARKAIGEKNSIKLRGRSLPEEHKRKISENHSRHNADCKISETQKEKIRAKLVGRKLSQETIERMKLAQRGHVVKPENVAKAQATKRKTFDARYKLVLDLHESGLKRYEIVEKLGVSYGFVSRAIRRQRKHDQKI